MAKREAAQEMVAGLRHRRVGYEGLQFHTLVSVPEPLWYHTVAQCHKTAAQPTLNSLWVSGLSDE